MQAQTLNRDGGRCRSLRYGFRRGTTGRPLGGQDRHCRPPLVVAYDSTAAQGDCSRADAVQFMIRVGVLANKDGR